MKKLIDFCEKYETPIWLLIVSINLFIIYFTNPDKSTILSEALFWIFFAIFSFIEKTLRNKKISNHSTKLSISQHANAGFIFVKILKII